MLNALNPSQSPAYNDAMKFVLPLLLAYAFTAQAQTATASQKPVDPKLHADVLRFVEISGVRKLVQNSFAQSIEDGKKSLVEKCTACAPAFGDEWAKRMSQQLNPDTFVAVFVEEYEKYLTDADILELIALRQNAVAAPSDQLKAKLATTMKTILDEASGRCAQIGAKLGSDITRDIEAQHPDYMHSGSAPPKP